MGKGKGVTSYNGPEGASSASGEVVPPVVTTKAKAAPRKKPAKAKKR